MRKIKGLKVIILIVMVCSGIIGLSAQAEDKYSRKQHIESKGILDYANGTVVIDSADLIYLASEIDELERAYKVATVDALNQISTYYASSNGDISYDSEDNNVPSDEAAVLSFNDLYKGILKSQSVEHLADVQAADQNEDLLYYADKNASENHELTLTTTDANDYPVLIQPATTNNLTAGTSAWVDGSLIIGNGADNQIYYNRGFADGYAEKMDDAHIEYIYHEHTGNSNLDVIPDGHTVYTTTSPGGCYKDAGHTHDKTIECSKSYCGGWKEHIHNSASDGIEMGDGHLFCQDRCAICHGEWSWGDDNNCKNINYKCGYPTNTYKVNCGKSTSTMVGATIVWDD